LGHFHKLVAKVLNAHWGRWENFWAVEQPNAVHLVDPEARLEKLVYLLANPVAADLVERVAEWPGASSLSLSLSGATRRVLRPNGFFRKERRGRMPAEVTLVVERPEGFEAMSPAEWRDLLGRALAREEAKACALRAEHGKEVASASRLLTVSPNECPDTVEPRGGLRPSVACSETPTRQDELIAVRGFRAAHRSAMREWIAGDRCVQFPPGTYRMRKLGARCE
jgi:hypothetical protein